MSWVLPLPAVLPLLAAAFVVATGHVLPRRAVDGVAIAGATSVCALGVLLMTQAGDRELLHWFGGWQPRSGIPLGIDFVADPLGAAMVALTGGLVSVALIYSWAYMTEAAPLFDPLLLVCCGALCGFALSGDLFNLFVWLELAAVAAYALTGFDVRRIGPLQGAVNFAITNTLGGYFVLLGIALLYAHAGALNLAQLGHALATAGKPGGIVIVALTMITIGLLCKAAVVPFHLWLDDAYAVAPVPVCAVFAGVMTDIGLFGVARVYWTVFDAPFGLHRHTVGSVLIALGVAGALLGGTMALLQRHLKRMLAYSVICHVGIMVAGVGLLSAGGLAGAADMLLAHGLLTAGLFFAVGVLVVRLGSVDELRLQGKAGDMRLLGVLWTLAALGLAGGPYLGDYLGHALIDEAASAAGRGWIAPILWLSGALASAAVLRAGARIFLGLGPRTDALLSPEMDEKSPARGGGGVLVAVTAMVVVLGSLVSVVPGLASRSHFAASRFVDRAAYAKRVLHGMPAAHAPHLPLTLEPASPGTVLYGFGAALLALALAALLLYRERLPRTVRAVGASVFVPPLAILKAAHSGIIGDYIMWLTVGTTLIGGVWAVTLR
jgi:multicomponent Na+:H+ antiporter subunit D